MFVLRQWEALDETLSLREGSNPEQRAPRRIRQRQAAPIRPFSLLTIAQILDVFARVRMRMGPEEIKLFFRAMKTILLTGEQDGGHRSRATASARNNTLSPGFVIPVLAMMYHTRVGSRALLRRLQQCESDILKNSSDRDCRRWEVYMKDLTARLDKQEG